MLQGVVALACHPTAPMVFTGCLDGVLRGWDIRTGASRCTRLKHSMACTAGLVPNMPDQ